MSFFSRILGKFNTPLAIAKAALVKLPPLNCTDDVLLIAWFNVGLSRDPPTLICPDCLGDKFYDGPHGGMSVNVYCANEACGARFNIAVMDDGRHPTETIQGERIGKSKLTVAT